MFLLKALVVIVMFGCSWQHTKEVEKKTHQLACCIINGKRNRKKEIKTEKEPVTKKKLLL